MQAQRINRISSKAISGLSFIALVAVITGYMIAPQPDEGSAAHIFQIAIVLLVPTLVTFLITVNWKRPLSGARPLAFPSAILAVAFAALYYLEHYR